MSLADLTTEEIAMFQLIEQGFIGISNGITLIRAEDAVTGKPVAVLTVFKPGVEEGTFITEPVARLLTDPSEVINPQFEHTDGAGHAKEDKGNGTDNHTGDAPGSGGNGLDS
jgi:hypothetical protein